MEHPEWRSVVREPWVEMSPGTDPKVTPQQDTHATVYTRALLTPRLVAIYTDSVCVYLPVQMCSPTCVCVFWGRTWAKTLSRTFRKCWRLLNRARRRAAEGRGERWGVVFSSCTARSWPTQTQVGAALKEVQPKALQVLLRLSCSVLGINQLCSGIWRKESYLVM